MDSMDVKTRRKEAALLGDSRKDRLKNWNIIKELLNHLVMKVW